MLDLHCCTGFSLVATSGSHSLAAVCEHLIVVASLVAEHRLQSTGPIAVAQGLFASQHMESSWIRD